MAGISPAWTVFYCPFSRTEAAKMPVFLKSMPEAGILKT